MRRKERAAEDRKRRLMQILIGFFIIVIMVLSIVQIAENRDTRQKLSFNGHQFTPTQGGVSVKGKSGLLLQSAPLEKNGTVYLFQNAYGNIISLDAAPGTATSVKNATYLIMTFDPETSTEQLQLLDYLRLELSKNLKIGSAKRSQSENYPGLPVINCSQAGNGVVILEFALRNDTYNNVTITRNGDCFSITGDPYGLIVAKDYLLLASNEVITDDTT